MKRSIAKVVPLNAHRPRIDAGRSATDAPLCMSPENFCICWMTEWFALAERVGAERSSAVGKNHALEPAEREKIC